jgi:glucose-1-phosphate thymidylyltransferase
VANKPVLKYCLDNIRAIGITDIGIVVGDQRDQIESVIGDGSELGLDIRYIQQDTPRGLAHCVQISRHFLGDHDFVMYLGDNMLLDGIAKNTAAFMLDRPDASVAITKVDQPSQYGIVELDSGGQITALLEKPANPRSDLAIMGVYFFTPAIHESIMRIRPSHRGELEITDALQDLLEHGGTITATEYTGAWKDTGRVDDLLDCNRLVLDGMSADVRGDVDRTSRLIGQVVVHPLARIVRSRLEGPLVVGAGTVIRDSVIGPHTSIGPDCSLAGADIAHSIVFDNVAIEQVVGIRDSLIGRHSNIRAGKDITRRRLLVGDHSDIKVPT